MQINHPSHYRPGKYEAIKVIEAWNLDFYLGNAVKYISRCGKKVPISDGISTLDASIEDLEKAVWYLQRKISQLKK